MRNTTNVPLKPVETKRASEGICDQIRQLILDGRIQPGERLPSERKMMEMMHRSRPTVREAMRVLEQEGYIKIYPGSSGAVVQEVTLDNAVQSLESIVERSHLGTEQILEFRRMTESTSAELAARRRTTEDLKRMEEILDKAHKAVGEAELFGRFDVQFHLAVAEASQNPLFSIMLQVFRNMDMIGRALTEVLHAGEKGEQEHRYERILKAHHGIYQAVREGQPERAGEEMKHHLMDAEQDILKKYRQG